MTCMRASVSSLGTRTLSDGRAYQVASDVRYLTNYDQYGMILMYICLWFLQWINVTCVRVSVSSLGTRTLSDGRAYQVASDVRYLTNYDQYGMILMFVVVFTIGYM